MPSRRDVLAALALFLLAAAAFSPALRNGFGDVDDTDYVTENVHVRAGLGPAGVAWAFTSIEAANWHPLTWISHMADVSLFGLDPRGHHATSVALHAASTALLFLALRLMTGRAGLAFVAAALFGVHPLRVESVAWIAERKDVLSTFFATATLLAYASFVRERSPRRMAAVTAFYALGLLAKPMLVTLPFALLLLDRWPLDRLRAKEDWAPLVREKLSLFALAAASCIVTYVAQSRGHAVQSLEILPLGTRAANAVVTYVVYLGQAIWPARLSFFYPHAGYTGAGDLSAARVGLAALALVAVSTIVFRARRPAPYLLVGWCWYLGLLVPVLGLVQVGEQSHADRYTYLPMIGPTVAVVWGIADWAERWGPVGRRAAAIAAVLGILIFSERTYAQTRTWHRLEDLYAQALSHTENNFVAHNNLGVLLAKDGKVEEAKAHFEAAVRAYPGYAEGEDNLGSALLKEGRTEEALPHFLIAVAHGPLDPEIRNNLGNALIAAGRVTEGIAELREAVRLKPGYANAHFNLAMALGRQGRFDDALKEFDAAVALAPERADAWANRGLLLATIGRKAEAIADFRRALTIRPDWPDVRAALAKAER